MKNPKLIDDHATAASKWADRAQAAANQAMLLMDQNQEEELADQAELSEAEREKRWRAQDQRREIIMEAMTRTAVYALAALAQGAAASAQAARQ